MRSEFVQEVMVTTNQTDLLWDIMESEARERYFIGDAEKPGFLICTGVFSARSRCTLYMNHVAAIGAFPTFKQARERVREIVAKATKPITVFREIDNQKVLFAMKESV